MKMDDCGWKWIKMDANWDFMWNGWKVLFWKSQRSQRSDKVKDSLTKKWFFKVKRCNGSWRFACGYVLSSHIIFGVSSPWNYVITTMSPNWQNLLASLSWCISHPCHCRCQPHFHSMSPHPLHLHLPENFDDLNVFSGNQKQNMNYLFEQKTWRRAPVNPLSRPIALSAPSSSRIFEKKVKRRLKTGELDVTLPWSKSLL